MDFLNRILIKWRIFGGFGIVVVLGIAMAVYGVVALSNVGSYVTTLTKLSENSVRVLQSTKLIEAMRRGATRYASAPDATLQKEFNDNQAKAEELLKASAKATLSQDRLRAYNAVIDELEQHRSVFDQLVKNATTAEENKAKLFTGGDELTAATNKMFEAARATGNQQVMTRAFEV